MFAMGWNCVSSPENKAYRHRSLRQLLLKQSVDSAFRLVLHRRKARRGKPHHQNRERQQQNPATQIDDPQIRRSMVRNVADQQPRQGGDRHVDQEPDWHVVGLEQ